MRSQRTTIAAVCPSCDTHFTIPVRYDDPVARFWTYVDKNGPVPEHVPDLGPCWMWKGFLHRGRALFKWKGQTAAASRVAWEITYGSSPGKLWVLHRCDEGACVNPDHFFLGDQFVNMRDMHAKRRAGYITKPERMARGERNGRYTKPENTLRGEDHGMAKLTAEQVRTIRAVYVKGSLSHGARPLGRRYGVTSTNILAIVRRQIWTSLE